MVGKPKYKKNDIVSFKIRRDNQEYTLTGEVYIVDRWGTFEDDSDASYDIMVKESNFPVQHPCLFKHIGEASVFDPE